MLTRVVWLAAGRKVQESTSLGARTRREARGDKVASGRGVGVQARFLGQNKKGDGGGGGGDEQQQQQQAATAGGDNGRWEQSQGVNPG